jgi:hypothetical protein
VAQSLLFTLSLEGLGLLALIFEGSFEGTVLLDLLFYRLPHQDLRVPHPSRSSAKGGLLRSNISLSLLFISVPGVYPDPVGVFFPL